MGGDDRDRVTPATVMTVTDVWLRCTARAIHERRLWLTELDAAIGDGDHGINLDRGFSAVLGDLETGSIPTGGVAELMTSAGRRLLGLVGGASGALYGRALMTAGTRLAERTGDEELGRRALVEIALAGAIDGIAALGRAVPGDKTMLDALSPALAALRAVPPDAPERDAMLAMAEHRHDPAGGPQGPRQLPRRAVRRPSRPWCGVERNPDPLSRGRRDRD